LMNACLCRCLGLRTQGEGGVETKIPNVLSSYTRRTENEGWVTATFFSDGEPRVTPFSVRCLGPGACSHAMRSAT
jgi:hypothetical protein